MCMKITHERFQLSTCSIGLDDALQHEVSIIYSTKMVASSPLRWGQPFASCVFGTIIVGMSTIIIKGLKRSQRTKGIDNVNGSLVVLIDNMINGLEVKENKNFQNKSNTKNWNVKLFFLGKILEC